MERMIRALPILTVVVALWAGLAFSQVLLKPTAARQPQFMITGHDRGLALCLPAGATEPVHTVASSQGAAIEFSLAGFEANEAVQLTFTLPDGRVKTLDEMLALDGALTSTNATLPRPLSSDESGEAFFFYSTSTNWPVGCYTIQAVGLKSGVISTAYLLIIAASPPTTASFSTATLRVTDVRGVAMGPPGTQVAAYGAGFLSGEEVTLRATLPNSTTVTFPAQVQSDASGDFKVSFQFGSVRQIGIYIFTATGSKSGFTATAQFEVTRDLPPPPEGLRAILSDIPTSPGDRRVEIQGAGFTPLEGLTLFLRTPVAPPTYGVIYPLTPLFVNEQGQFVIAFVLDRRYPVGAYNLSATGTVSGRSVSVTFIR